MTTQIDANDVINSLLQQIAELSQQIAMLKVQLTISEKQPEEGGSVDE